MSNSFPQMLPLVLRSTRLKIWKTKIYI